MAAQEPTVPSSPPPAGGGGSGGVTIGWKAIAISAVAILVILAIVGAVFAMSGGDEASAEEITLEPISSTGNNPFAPSVGTDEANVTPPPSSGGSYSGNLEGLYGGTLNVSSCDPQKLVTFLQQHPDKGRAWASTLGITFDQIPEYVSGLTPVILRSDTYVTNHGFVNGVANPIPAILQAGTAVLVDKYGVPVTKCYCGNPLTPPSRCDKCTYTGPKWSGFNPGGITIVNKSTTIIDIFVLVDPKTGEPFTRPPGTDGGSDTPGTTGTTTTTTTSSTSTTLGTATVPTAPRHGASHRAAIRAVAGAAGDRPGTAGFAAVLPVPGTHRGLDGWQLEHEPGRHGQLLRPHNRDRHRQRRPSDVRVVRRPSDAALHAAERSRPGRERPLLAAQLSGRPRTAARVRPPARDRAWRGTRGR